MKKNLHKLLTVTMVLSICTAITMAQTGPGGVGGHEDDIKEGDPINCFWLRANDLSLSEGDAVSSWSDVSGYNHKAVTGINGVEGITFQKDKVNSYPWVHFAGINYLKVADNDVLDGGMGFAIFVVAKRDPYAGNKYGHGSNLVTKRAHWNAWSHVPEISQDPAGLQHAYELRWDKVGGNAESGDTANITAYMNGNLPDGAGSDVFPTPENTLSTDSSYLISWAYNGLDPETEGSYGAFVRINGLMTNRRYEGNPNPISVGQVVNSNKDLWIGAAQLDPPGQFGQNDAKDDICPTCTEEGLLEGAISEVIIYKGILWHTHVFIIENYLSVKYDLPIDSAKYYDDDVCVHDLVGIGNEMGDDKIHASSRSGALGLDSLNESLDAPKEYLFAAHDGAEYTETSEGIQNGTRWGRTWKIKKMGQIDAALSFNFIEAGITMQTPRDYRVIYKANMEDEFTPIDAIARKQLRTLIFNLTDEQIQDGYYSIALMGEETAIEAYNLSDFLMIHPNPASDFLNISFNQQTNGPLSIRILDYTGREMLRFEDVKSVNEYRKQISTASLESGAYFLELKMDDHYAVKPLIKK